MSPHSFQVASAFSGNTVLGSSMVGHNGGWEKIEERGTGDHPTPQELALSVGTVSGSIACLPGSQIDF